MMKISTRRIIYPKVALCHTKVLNMMSHFIKTKFRISEYSFQVSDDLNLGGSGQGNGGVANILALNNIITSYYIFKGQSEIYV